VVLARHRAPVLQHGARTPSGPTSREHPRVLRDRTVSFSAFQLRLRAFYAMQDTETPALINVRCGSL